MFFHRPLNEPELELVDGYTVGGWITYVEWSLAG